MNTHTSATPQGTPETPTPPAEGSDVNVRGILIFVGLLVVTGVVIHFALYWMGHHFRKEAAHRATVVKGQQPVPTASRNPPNFPAPRLQLAPSVDMQTLRTREENLLNSYGWVNRTSGVVRIPIERAMEIVAQSGLPGSDSSKREKSPVDLIKERSERK